MCVCRKNPGLISECVTFSTIIKRGIWRAAYAPGDGPVRRTLVNLYSACIYVNQLLSVNKLVLSYLLLRLLPQVSNNIWSWLCGLSLFPSLALFLSMSLPKSYSLLQYYLSQRHCHCFYRKPYLLTPLSVVINIGITFGLVIHVSPGIEPGYIVFPSQK
jgi:hypothetical protein